MKEECYTISKFIKSVDRFFNNLNYDEIGLKLQRSNKTFYNDQTEFICEYIRTELKGLLIASKVSKGLGGKVEKNKINV